MPDILIRDKAAVDQFGDPIGDGTEGTLIEDVYQYPRVSTETSEGTLVVGINLLLHPHQRPIPTAAQQVVVGVVLDENRQPVPNTGEVYEVIGEPGEWTYPDGTEAVVEVALKRWRG